MATAKEILIDFYGENDSRAHDIDMIELMQMYAKAKLEEAAERARVKYTPHLSEPRYVDKDSIINTPLD